RIPIMQGWFYLVFQSLVLDLFGVGLIVGALIGAYKRYVVRPQRLTHGLASDGYFLASLFVIGVTGFLVEGLRIVATADPWAAWSPVGRLTGLALVWLGVDALPVQLSLHKGLWW